MVRVRLSMIGGLLLLAVACVLPWGTFVAWSAESVPYQDPTPELVQEQAHAIARLEHLLIACASVCAVLIVLGVGILVYGLRRWLQLRRDGGARA